MNNKPKPGQFIAMRDGLEEKVELQNNKETGEIQTGKKLSKNTTEGEQKLNLFTTNNGLSND